MDRASELLRRAGKSKEAIARMRAPWEDAADEEAASKLWFDEPPVCAAWPTNPVRLNQRLRIQQGIFLAPGDISQPFMQNLDSLGRSNPARVLRIVIPPLVARDGIKHLFAMAISRTTLFPGLDGFCQSLAVYHPGVYAPVKW
jgi:hypothetical protein